MSNRNYKTAKFIATGNDGKVSTVKSHMSWRKSWFLIVPGSFGGGGGYTDLLFYDRVNGEAKVYTSDGKGSIELLKHHKNWRKSWDIIVPGKFAIGPNLTALFFYDRSKGEAKFVSSNIEGGIKLLKHHKGWRKSWDIIIPFDTGGVWTGLLCYDRTVGEGKIFSTDGKGNVKLVKHYKGWKKTWDIIIPGNFGKNVLTSDLLFYRRVVGEAKFFSTNKKGKFTLLAHHKNWDKYWDVIVPWSSPTSRTKLLCYNRTKGKGVFTETKYFNIKPVKSYNNWRKTWASIVPGHFHDGGGRDLLFYEHGVRLRIRAIKCSDDDGAREANTSLSEVNAWIDRANKVYAGAGIQFDPVTKLHKLKNTLINSLAKKEKGDKPEVKKKKEESKAEAQKYALKYRGEIVVYFRYGKGTSPTGGGFSGKKAEYVAMPGFSVTKTTAFYQDGRSKKIQNIKLMAHELGHYLGLDHTFVGVEYDSGNPDAAVIAYLKEKKAKTASALDGDKSTVRDTPPDVGKKYFEDKGWNPADLSQEIRIKSATNGIDFTFNPDRHNVISYFNCDDYYRITQDQYRRVYEFLRQPIRKHLLKE